jgi:hypothetical protein
MFIAKLTLVIHLTMSHGTWLMLRYEVPTEYKDTVSCLADAHDLMMRNPSIKKANCTLVEKLYIEKKTK